MTTHGSKNKLIKNICVSSLALSFCLAGNAFAQEKAEASSDASETVVVRGLKASIVKGIANKRKSAQIIESVVAEDIGKLPDNNVVEALQRVAGIQITARGGGEASAIFIRGMPDITTTVNGRSVFTGAGRQVALQDIPANLINRIDVYKTRSSEQIETGIAGQIDVSTNRPFDFKGKELSVAARGTYLETAEEFNPNVSVLASNRWNTGLGEVGALINLSYNNTKFRDQNLIAGAQVPFTSNTNVPPGFIPLERIFDTNIWQPGLNSGLPQAAGSTLRFPNGTNYPYLLARDAIISTDVYGDRTRTAANVSFQWRPNDKSEYIFEYMHEGYENKIYNSMHFTFVDWWGSLTPADISGITLIPGTNIIKTRSLNNVYGFNSGDATQQKTDTNVYSVTGKWNLTDKLSLKGDVTVQDTEFNTQFFAIRTDRVASRITYDINENDGLPGYHFDNDALMTNPNTWNVAQLYDNAQRDTGNAVTLTLDGKYEANMGALKNITFGLRFDEHNAKVERWGQDSFLGRNLSTFDPKYYFLTEDFYQGESNSPTSWLNFNTQAAFDDLDAIRRLYPNMRLSSALQFSPDFDIREDTTNAYLQGEFENELFGRSLKTLAGVRYVGVSTNMQFGSVSRNATVEKFLPSVTVRYDLNKDLRLRLNYGETLRRPNFGDLNPNYILTGDLSNVGYGQGRGGNPDLQPTYAKNLDTSLEWYFNRDGLLFTTLFKRNIEGLVVPYRLKTTIPNSGQNTNTFVISQPVNASDGEIQGAEIGFTYFPRTLPWKLDGLGFTGSMTFLESSQNIPQTDSSGAVIGQTQTSFFGVSDFSYNATIAYDKGPIDMRVSYVWRKEFLNNNEAALFANPIGVWIRPEASLDAQASYEINDKLSVSIDAVNILGAKSQSYYHFAGAGSPLTTNNGNFKISRSFSVGVRWRL